jgi:hypothetical protein
MREGGMNTYFESYKILPSTTLRTMLIYEGKVDGQDPARYDAIRSLLGQRRTINVRVQGKVYLEKLL